MSNLDDWKAVGRWISNKGQELSNFINYALNGGAARDASAMAAGRTITGYSSPTSRASLNYHTNYTPASTKTAREQASRDQLSTRGRR